MKKGIMFGVILGMMTVFIACGTETQDVSNENDKSAKSAVVSETVADEQIEDEEIDEEIDEETAYRRFLHLEEGDIVANVDPGLTLGYFADDVSKTGDTLTFAELKELMSKDDVGDAIDSEVYYTFVKGGSRKILVVKFESEDVPVSENVFLFCYYEKQLHLSYSYASWDRSTSQLHKSGYYYSQGSSGAGESMEKYGYIDAAGKIRDVYSVSTLYEEWIGLHTDQEIFEKVYKKYKGEKKPLDMYTIGEDVYLSFEVPEGESLSEEDQKFILKTSSLGFKWLIQDEVKALIAERNEELGLSEEFYSSKDVEWTKL